MARGITILTFGCGLEGPATGNELLFKGRGGGLALARLHFCRAATQVRQAAFQPLWTHCLLYITQRMQGGGEPTLAIVTVAGWRFVLAGLVVGARRVGAGGGMVTVAAFPSSSLFSTVSGLTIFLFFLGFGFVCTASWRVGAVVGAAE